MTREDGICDGTERSCDAFLAIQEAYEKWAGKRLDPPDFERISQSLRQAGLI